MKAGHGGVPLVSALQRTAYYTPIFAYCESNIRQAVCIPWLFPTTSPPQYNPKELQCPSHRETVPPCRTLSSEISMGHSSHIRLPCYVMCQPQPTISGCARRFKANTGTLPHQFAVTAPTSQSALQRANAPQHCPLTKGSHALPCTDVYCIHTGCPLAMPT